MSEVIGSGSRKVNIELHLVYSANVKIITDMDTVRNYYFNQKIEDVTVTVNDTPLEMQSRTPEDKVPLVDLKNWAGDYVSDTMHCCVYRFTLCYEPQYETVETEAKKGVFRKETKQSKAFVPYTTCEISVSFKDESGIRWNWTIPAAEVHLEDKPESDMRYFVSAIRDDTTKYFNGFVNGCRRGQAML